MIKDAQYYSSLDLETVAKSLPRERGERLRSEKLADIVNALFQKIETEGEKVHASTLERLLGKPDKKEVKKGFEVWSYGWIGKHGDNEYESAIPFKVCGGEVIEIAKGT